jgi:hypothetical protein
MLTRAGSPAGPGWMRTWSLAMGGGSEPHLVRYRRRWLVGFWIVWATFMVVGFVVSRPFAARSPGTYRSAIEIAGVPLFAYGPEARGIVAVGGVAVGLIAFGGIAVGGIAFGGLALGGVVALGGLAVGCLALGGGALGYFALGGVAVGGYAYAGGGVALGYHEASGAQRERLLATG